MWPLQQRDLAWIYNIMNQRKNLGQPGGQFTGNWVQQAISEHYRTRLTELLNDPEYASQVLALDASGKLTPQAVLELYDQRRQKLLAAKQQEEQRKQRDFWYKADNFLGRNKWLLMGVLGGLSGNNMLGMMLPLLLLDREENEKE